jgi:hypothetical protein
MHLIPIIATATEDLGHSHSVMDALPHLGGMLMVLVTLTLLWGLTALVSKLVAVIHPKSPAVFGPPPASGSAATAALAGATPAADTGLAPEIVAVIAAAVAASTGQTLRIVSIKPMITSWEKAGRHSVLTSHRIR